MLFGRYSVRVRLDDVEYDGYSSGKKLINSKMLLGRMNSNFEGVYSLSNEEHIFYLFATNREDAKICS